MDESIVKTTQRPEERELVKKKAELANLEEILAERELELLTFEVELREFEQLYLKTVGIFYSEIDDLEAKIAEAKAAASPDDKEARIKAESARARAKESAHTTDSAIDRQPKEKFKPSDSLKKLFRELARLLHPDLELNEKEKVKRHELMARANKAYEEGDEALLAKMLEERKASPDTVEGDGVGAELIRLIRRIAQVEERIEFIDVEFESLVGSDLFELKAKVEEAEQAGRDLLEEMAKPIKEKIKELQLSLRGL